MYLSIHHVKKIVFGKCDQWGTKDNPRQTDTRTYSLTVLDRNNEWNEVRVYVDDDSIVPTIDSQITDSKNNPIGDWFTADIDGINLELPPLPEESEPAKPAKTDSEKLMDAVHLIEEVRANGRNDLDRSDRRTLHDLAIRVQSVAQCGF